MFSESTRELANARPSVPPMRTAPPNNRSGTKESAALAAIDSSTAPAIFTAPASSSSERIHFQASPKISSGNKNADAPNNCKQRSDRYAPG